ncbi:hypothetical protein [Candidatus Mycoplasma haematobovis]|nr:hypothetical protein [Candidatus Mycoplasma haematobovis]
MFTSNFCVWRTSLFDYAKGIFKDNKIRKLNTDGDEDIWNHYSQRETWFLSLIFQKEIDVSNQHYRDLLKQKLKEKCSKVNWNQERHDFDGSQPYIPFCTDGLWKWKTRSLII